VYSFSLSVTVSVFAYPISIRIRSVNIRYVSDIRFWRIQISFFHIRQYLYSYPYSKVGCRYKYGEGNIWSVFDPIAPLGLIGPDPTVP